MSERFRAERIGHSQADYTMIALLVLLLGLGLSTLFSASYYYGARVFGNAEHFLDRQLVFVAVGLVVAYFLSRVPLELVRKAVPALVFVTFVLMLLTFVPGLGMQTLGARRWIVIFGQSFQPSELVKFTLIVYLSHIFSKKRDKIDDLMNTILPPLIVSTLFIALVYFQNDYSTAVVSYSARNEIRSTI